MNTIQSLNPKKSLDLETIGITGAIYKNLFKLNKNYDYLDEAIKEQCSVCGKNHNIVCINDNTTIKEFSYNYYIPKESGCSWSEDERYCVLVKWEDFKNDPETYIDNAFNKRKSEISKKTKVRP